MGWLEEYGREEQYGGKEGEGGIITGRKKRKGEKDGGAAVLSVNETEEKDKNTKEIRDVK